MHAVLGRLGFRDRHKHERQLAGLGGVIIGRFDHHFVGLLEGDRPRQRHRPEPGQPGGVGGVNDEMDQETVSRIFAEHIGSGDYDEGVVDGMKCDEHGNVYVTGPRGIWVFGADGTHLGVIRMPEIAGNLWRLGTL